MVVYGGDELGQRDLFIMIVKDLRRSLDYLETRSDIASEKFAYYGLSFGAWAGAAVLAVEDRIRASVLSDGGLLRFKVSPEIDPFNFVSRVKVPVLMLNGQYDFNFPPETSQSTFFQMLRTRKRDKRRVLFESSHGAYVGSDQNRRIAETISWLDQYLGRPEKAEGDRGRNDP